MPLPSGCTICIIDWTSKIVGLEFGDIVGSSSVRGQRQLIMQRRHHRSQRQLAHHASSYGPSPVVVLWGAGLIKGVARFAKNIAGGAIDAATEITGGKKSPIGAIVGGVGDLAKGIISAGVSVISTANDAARSVALTGTDTAKNILMVKDSSSESDKVKRKPVPGGHGPGGHGPGGGHGAGGQGGHGGPGGHGGQGGHGGPGPHGGHPGAPRPGGQARTKTHAVEE